MAAVAAFALQGGSGGQKMLAGVAETVEFHVAATQPGRLLAVAVQTGDKVRAGDVMAELDPALITREIAVLQAELAQAEAAVHAEELLLGRDRLEQQRTFEKSVDQGEVGLLQAKLDAERDRAELDGLRVRIRWWGKWVEQQVASAQQLEELKAQAEVAQRRVELDEQAVTTWQGQLDKIRSRLGRYEQNGAPMPPQPMGPEVAGLRAAVDVAKAKLAVLQQQRAHMTLRAPADGVVSAVLLRPGDVVTAGLPLATVRDAAPRRVLAFGASGQLRDVHIGQAADIITHDGHSKPQPGRVVAVGLGVMEQPPQLPLGLYGRPAWNESVVVQLDEATLRPGEVVDVIVQDRDAPKQSTPPARPVQQIPMAPAVALPPAPSPTMTATPAGGPAAQPLPPSGTITNIEAELPAGMRPLEVPSELAKVSRFEPSGWIWLPEWNAYLTVSDDTGLAPHDQEQDKPSGADHPPWMFRIDAQGRVAPQPVIVKGVPQLDDLESITRTRDGQLWALASQSVSKRGHRPMARTWLLRLRMEGDHLQVTGRASLTRALSRLPKDQIAGLGLVEQAHGFKKGVAGFDKLLDVEGMTADGADLLLGLKKPRSQGGALLWRLRTPDQVLDNDRLTAGQLTRLPPLDLTAGLGADARPATISELLRLPNGALLVLAVAQPGGPDTAMASALWRAELSGDQWKLRRVRDFIGVHAEGLSLGPTPGVVAVVFDRREQTPTWLEAAISP